MLQDVGAAILSGKIRVPDVILCDWDDTFFNNEVLFRGAVAKIYASNSDIVKPEFAATLKGSSLQEKAEEISIRFTGISLDDVLTEMFHPDIDALLVEFRRYYSEMKNGAGNLLLPGAFEFVECIKKHELPVALVSNKIGNQLRDEASGLGIADYFFTMLGRDDVTKNKPSPVHAFEALERLGSDVDVADVAHMSWLVGDSLTDIECAIASGCFPVYVGYEFSLTDEMVEMAQNNKMLICSDLLVVKDVLDKLMSQ